MKYRLTSVTYCLRYLRLVRYNIHAETLKYLSLYGYTMQNVSKHTRRIPEGHRPPRNYENLVEVNRKVQALSPSGTMSRIYEADSLMRDLGIPSPDTRTLLSYIQAITLHVASGLEWRDSLYASALSNGDLDATDRHFLADAVKEIQANEKSYNLRNRHG